MAGNINEDYEPAPITISSRNAAYSSESGKRMAEETSLRGLVAQREAATSDVVSHFTNARSFYQQLVDRRTALKDAADAAAPEGATELTTRQEEANMALMTARTEKEKIDALYPDDPDDPTVDLVSELLKTGGDDGQALVDAISNTYDDTQANKDEIDTLKGQLTDADGNPIDLSNLGDTEAVTQNTNDITALDTRVADNEEDIAQINTDLYGTTSSQHADATACADGAGGLVNIANCADARSRHNEADIADLGGDIEGLEGRVGDNEDDIATNAAGIMTNAGNIATNSADIMTNAGNIATNSADIMTNAGNIATNSADIMTNAGNIAMNSEGIMTNAGDIAMNSEYIMTNAGNIAMNAEGIMTNAGNIAMTYEVAKHADEVAHRADHKADANAMAIGSNRSSIMQNAGRIGELSEDLDVVRAGVAASMALAGMPAINGRGISIGVGSFDGESAFAVGFQIQGEQASFKIGVTSSGGETGASAGVGFNF